MSKKIKQGNLEGNNKKKYIDTFDFFLIGDENVGKTCLLNRYCNDFYTSYKKKKKKPEIFVLSTLNNYQEFKLQFWDLQFNQEDLYSNQEIIKKSDGIIYVCSLNSKQSLNNILKWNKILEDYEDLSKKQKMLFVNKNDLEDGIEISEQDINKLCTELKIANYKMSAKTGNGVKKGFAEFIHRAITKVYNYESNKNDNNIEQGKKGNKGNQKEDCVIL